MKKIHKIQLLILSKLLFADRLLYSEIKPDEMEGSQFKFHLDKLKKSGFVQKEDEYYSLSEKGKNYANSFDLDYKHSNVQAKHTVVMCCVSKNFKQVLIYKRLKNPFYGCLGFPTGKVRYGESIEEAAIRELKEETNLSGSSPELVGIRHFRVYTKQDKKLVEDKVMYIFRFIEPKGRLKDDKEGEFQWVPIDRIRSVVKKPLEEFDEFLEMVLDKKSHLTFKESKHITDRF